jgi:hypothetical protein
MSHAPQNLAPARIPLMKMPVAFYGISYNYRDAVGNDPSKPRDIRIVTEASKAALERLDAYVTRIADGLVAEITQALKSKGPAMVSEHISQAAWTMPIVLHRLPTDCEIPIKLIPLLHEHMYYVYSTYRSTGDQTLAAFVVGYSEYLYYLLDDAKSDPIPGSDRKFHVEQLLRGNPYWAIKWLEKHYDEQQFQDLLNNIYSMREHDAWCAHCYHWLRTRSARPEVKKEEAVKILETLGSSPYVALITAVQYRDINVDSLLPEVERHPMWAYNWLRLVGDKRGNVTTLLNVLTLWTPWGVQYLEDMQYIPKELRMSPEDASEMWESIKQKAANPYWAEWLDRYQEKREKKRP